MICTFIFMGCFFLAVWHDHGEVPTLNCKIKWKGIDFSGVPNVSDFRIGVDISSQSAGVICDSKNSTGSPEEREARS